MNQNTQEIIFALQSLVGRSHVLLNELDQIPYTTGFRVGNGQALAVVLPQTMWEIWQTLEICVKYDLIVLMQASNTGVTGGSTPDGQNYDRQVVIISTRAVKGIQLIDHAQQFIAFPGTTLTELENALKPYQREPHSVIGSSCIGASVIGGVCNNSGGSLIRRGPAFTEKSLFAQLDDQGNLQLINHLGIELGNTPFEIFQRLQNQQYTIGEAEGWSGRIWAEDYAESLRDISSPTPTRYNGNPAYLHDSSGSSGKLAVFAVRLPTFPASGASTTFYIGTNNEYELIELRRFLLSQLTVLPSQAEYIHQQAFNLTVRYAKHIYKTIGKYGAEKIPEFFALKNKWDKVFKRLPFFPDNTVDRFLQCINTITSSGVAPRLADYQQQFEHHLMIKTDESASAELERLLTSFFSHTKRQGSFFKCTTAEETNAFLIRFGVGACTIYYCGAHNIDTNQRLIAFDVALRRNDDEWRIKLPPELQNQVLLDSCCGHFFCFVNHQDYILKAGVDPHQFKKKY